MHMLETYPLLVAKRNNISMKSQSELIMGETGSETVDEEGCTLHIKNSGTKQVRINDSVTRRLADQTINRGIEQR